MRSERTNSFLEAEKQSFHVHTREGRIHFSQITNRSITQFPWKKQKLKKEEKEKKKKYGGQENDF